MKRKNLLDIDYNTYLNYFNVLAIGLITAAISFSVAWIAKQIPYEYFETALIFIVIFFMFSFAAIHEKLDNIKMKISALRLN